MSASTPSHILLASNLLRETKLLEATRVIQAALMPGRRSAPELMLEEALGQAIRKPTAQFEDKRLSQPEDTLGETPKPTSRWSSHLRQPLAQTLNMLRNVGAPDLPFGNVIPRIIPNADPLPAGATFTSHSFSTAEGSRNFKLYVPSHPYSSPRPLLLMLHGCTQNADDFAAGTGMNLLAEELNLLVAYPEQSTAANRMKCWSWFSDSNQDRGGGEPYIIASITKKLVADHTIDPKQVFVAGFSAGGAMAAVLGATYPDVFSAIGVHSGLPYKAASDVPSAFAAMQNVHHITFQPALREGHLPRLIVFHGEHDKTVHPENGKRLFTARCRSEKANIDQLQSSKGACGDHTRTVFYSATGAPLAEHWLVHGGGHAWSGGRPHGSYTQARGPDASREMLRFFAARNDNNSGSLDHPFKE